MRVKLDSGTIYFYQTASDTSLFMCLESVELKQSNIFFNAFVFIQQSNNDSLDGWNGVNYIAMNSEMADWLSSLEASYDWLASNDFAEGTPKEQLIQSCFESIY